MPRIIPHSGLPVKQRWLRSAMHQDLHHAMYRSLLPRKRLESMISAESEDIDQCMMKSHNRHHSWRQPWRWR